MNAHCSHDLLWLPISLNVTGVLKVALILGQ
jgi:hypothetical protein